MMYNLQLQWLMAAYINGNGSIAQIKIRSGRFAFGLSTAMYFQAFLVLQCQRARVAKLDRGYEWGLADVIILASS